MEIKASAKFVKTTPDKARILAKLVVGNNPEKAVTQLTFCGRDAGKYIILVLKQAMDQVKTKGLEVENFKVKTFLVNEGPKLKRRRIRHQGRSTAILKRMAHIAIVLSDDSKEKDKNIKLKVSDKNIDEIKPEKTENKKVTKGSK